MLRSLENLSRSRREQFAPNFKNWKRNESHFTFFIFHVVPCLRLYLQNMVRREKGPQRARHGIRQPPCQREAISPERLA